jgi:hypothetical protein
MPASVAEFVQAAEDSGLLGADVVAECAVGMPPTSDATALANRLVKEGRLTAFQARHIYAGKARAHMAQTSPALATLIRNMRRMSAGILGIRSSVA